ncbi:MAG: aminotransferase class V-fold PLP-dependent enzyme [Phycisphaeraceae bacterium]|nr:aminotransferase class V-fold PLP-dependent enzyme [Phycisphaerales bacterium]MCB9859187.1 aminotransferase class V-fold PLP-dependent enzyme [Phycisphaeraceae bacterium]
MVRLYLDNAATSFPKPPGVYEAMLEFGTHIGSSPGRGHYAEAKQGAAILAETRSLLCDLFNGEDPNHVIFTLNTSDALNLAIKGILGHAILSRKRTTRPVHAITTRMDHNSVLRPLAAMHSQHDVQWTCVDADPKTGVIEPASVRDAMSDDTALVVINMASNVTGTIQDVASIADICRKRNIPLLVDAAQAAGHLPIDVQTLGIDLLAVPGHKGLLGPQGTGALYIRPGIEQRMTTVREGGTGSSYELDVQPDAMPERFEAGSHNTVGIAGWRVALQWLKQKSVETLRLHEVTLGEQLIRGFADLSCNGLQLLGPARMDLRVGVFSVVHQSIAPTTLAQRLEQHQVLVRSGIHCAPRAHRTFGTLENPRSLGATRLSLGPYITSHDIERTLSALADSVATPRVLASASVSS